MKKILKIFSVLFCFFAFSGIAKSQDSQFGLDESTTFAPYFSEYPIKWKNNKIFVRNVKINGVKASLKFDTGNNQSLSLNFSFADKINIDTTVIPKRQFYMATGKHYVQSGMFYLDSLMVGDVSFYNLAVYVNGSLNDEHGFDDYAGLLGNALLYEYETHLICNNLFFKSMMLLPLDSSGVSHANLNVKPRAVIPFDIVRGVPVIDVSVGNKVLRMIFDTGAQRSVICTKYESVLRGSLKNKNVRSSLVSANGTKIRANKYQFKAIRLGPKVIRNSTVFFSDLGHYANDSIDGYLGVDAIRGQHISINFKKKIICFY